MCFYDIHRTDAIYRIRTTNALLSMSILANGEHNENQIRRSCTRSHPNAGQRHDATPPIMVADRRGRQPDVALPESKGAPRPMAAQVAERVVQGHRRGWHVGDRLDWVRPADRRGDRRPPC